MSEALYRTYRPKMFSEVIGQEPIKIILRQAINTGKVGHAYLFSGARGVGKTTVARILAKAVNCLSLKDGEPDATCINCIQVQEGRFIDLIEIDAASYTGVENIRTITDHARFAPSTGKYKVFIIDEVHMLSRAAFNALLKTLEEPPAHVIFILATTEIQKVPATIISRSQRFDFRRVSVDEILTLLALIQKETGERVAPEALRTIALAADGSLRDVLSIFDQILSFGQGTIELSQVEEILGVARIDKVQRFVGLLLGLDGNAAVTFVRDYTVSGADLPQFVKAVLEYLRLMLLAKQGIDDSTFSALTSSEKETLKLQSKNLTGQRIIELIKSMMEAYREMRDSPLIELPLFSSVVRLTERSESVAQPELPSKSVVSSKQAQGVANLGEVVSMWSEVLKKVKEYNHSLISSLRTARLVDVVDEHLVLAFPYAFHKETVDARKNRIVIEQVLEDVFGRAIKIKVALEREIAAVPPSSSNQSADNSDKADLVHEALKVLGNMRDEV